METGANLISAVYPESNLPQDLPHNLRADRSGRLSEVSGEFESIFIRLFLKEALKPLFKGYLSQSGSADSIYRYYLTDTLARSIGPSGSIGISKLLQLQIKGESSDEE